MIAQISSEVYAMMSGIVMILMMSGITIMLVLEEGINYVGKRKQLVHLFMNHPWRIEAFVICSFWSFPIGIVSISVLASNSSVFSLLGTIVVAWPVLTYVLHRRLMDFQQTLGIGKKKEYDTILVARLSVTIWIISACGLVLSFFLAAFDISQETSYLLLGFCGIIMFFIPFRKSLALVRNQNTEIEGQVE